MDFLLLFLCFNSIFYFIAHRTLLVRLRLTCLSYSQRRIAGDFLSSRKAALAERCPPKTTSAAVAGS